MRSKAIAAIGILSLFASIVPAFAQTKIGVITSLTGSLAAFGEAHKNGYAIALDEINAKGGVLGKKSSSIFMTTRASLIRLCRVCQS